MGRFCYCSKVLPGKSDAIREHWKNKPPVKDAATKAAEISFWNHLKMTGFESWLQPGFKEDFMIHCLEGESLPHIFKGLREQISSGNEVALMLQAFYQDVLGKNYAHNDVEPDIEYLFDISLPTQSPIIKRAFFYPLLPQKEEEHRRFRKESMNEKRAVHEGSMKAFGVSRLSTWLQKIKSERYIVVYSERHADTPCSPSQRINQGKDSSEWREISATLMDHTGLKYEELSPQVDWLTQPKI